MSTLILSLSAIVFVSGLLFYARQSETCTLQYGGITWKFEQARTPEEQARGLMGRDALCEHCGMMFTFGEEKYLSFWMKDTLIPLDIYFYDTLGKLVDVARNMRPDGETKDPMIIHSKKPARYVLELEQGSLFPGDTVDIFTCR